MSQLFKRISQASLVFLFLFVFLIPGVVFSDTTELFPDANNLRPAPSGKQILNTDVDKFLNSQGVRSSLTSSIDPNVNPVRGCRIPTDIGSLFDYVLCLLDSAVVPFLIGLGLVLFLAGVLKFVSAGDNEEARQGGRNMMMFGIVSLFVMVSIWGFVNILSRSFFGTDSEIQSLPRKSSTVFKQGN